MIYWCFEPASLMLSVDDIGIVKPFCIHWWGHQYLSSAHREEYTVWEHGESANDKITWWHDEQLNWDTWTFTLHFQRQRKIRGFVSFINSVWADHNAAVVIVLVKVPDTSENLTQSFRLPWHHPEVHTAHWVTLSSPGSAPAELLLPTSAFLWLNCNKRIRPPPKPVSFPCQHIPGVTNKTVELLGEQTYVDLLQIRQTS